MASRPGCRKASASSTKRSLEPLPSVICATSTPSFAASRVLSTWPLPSGYSQVSPIARCMASSALGLGPKGFSFDASLMMSVRPSSRCNSSMGLPGTYGDSDRTLSTARSPGSLFVGVMSRILQERLTPRSPCRKHPGMRTRILALVAAVVAQWFHGALHAGELPDYMRFREDANGARLEIAIRSFSMPSGQRVDLMGVAHIADDAYYQELNRRFDAYDSVLFELVGDPEALTAPGPHPTSNSAVSTIQQAAGQYLGLTFQLDAIDYTRKNMVHADATADEFERMQKERGETMLTLFTRAMEVQMAAQMSGNVDPTSMSGLDTFGLIRILMSRDSAAEFKKVLAKSFAQMETLTA